MKASIEFDQYPMLRIWSGYAEAAYVAFQIRGLEASIEFPSDWHEHRRVWLRLGLGFMTIAVSLPWSGKVVPDQGQCSGPRYGFQFHSDMLWVYHGKATGSPRDGSQHTFYMPWSMKHVRHSYLNQDGTLHHNAAPSEYETPADTKAKHPYVYVRRSGEVQKRVATINGEEREWRLLYAPWLPWPRILRRSINVEFSDEVGERTGSWKGGTIGCGYDWRRGETQEQALRRMESERKF